MYLMIAVVGGEVSDPAAVQVQAQEMLVVRVFAGGGVVTVGIEKYVCLLLVDTLDLPYVPLALGEPADAVWN